MGSTAVLLQGCRGRFDDQIRSAQGDLDQIEGLLKEAIAKLFDSFNQLRTQMHEQSSPGMAPAEAVVNEVCWIISELLSTQQPLGQNVSTPLEEAHSRLQGAQVELRGAAEKQDRIDSRIDGIVNTAIVSFQFHDMVTQLVQHVRSKLELLDQVLGVLINQASDELQFAEVPRVKEIEQARSQIDGLFNQAIHKRENKPVRQDNLESGRIEWF